MRPNPEQKKTFAGKPGESREILLCETGLCDTNWSADIHRTVETLKTGALCTVEQNTKNETEVRHEGRRLGLLPRPTSIITGNLQKSGKTIVFSVSKIEDRGNAVEIAGELWMIE